MYFLKVFLFLAFVAVAIIDVFPSPSFVVPCVFLAIMFYLISTTYFTSENLSVIRSAAFLGGVNGIILFGLVYSIDSMIGSFHLVNAFLGVSVLILSGVFAGAWLNDNPYKHSVKIQSPA